MIHLPRRAAGLKVGLLGGSFDPPHSGHMRISEVALRRFGLDEVWWLFSPGNPLKTSGPAAMSRRIAKAKDLFHHPRVQFSNLEAELGTRYTAETLRAVTGAAPDMRFVWLMGADNLSQFHLWQDWRDIIETVPMGILARPGLRLSARVSRTARIYKQHKLPASASRLLPGRPAPAWCFINMPMNKTASSVIRATGAW
ncbi:MAG: nicotinate-nucleotide adenylyltransferase [Paracoccaceae bacterium]|nr:nicotinate-nucleotide adenylyltransferase [Loktanella sp.]